ncbi:synaptogyrin 4 L homeolog [Xenopus laevis]|uniref:Synaptogyrin 4 L homeolog n=1 Tax=Xenopus laevis TaxID=8355 RepID=A0A8J0QHX8_XENLA|nr:synaptogyrin 4 L homeolog [Xenopus laevis]
MEHLRPLFNSVQRSIMDNPVTAFIFRPLTIWRVLTLICSIIVCASLLSGGYQNLPTSSFLNCTLNDNSTACEYGISIGILGSIVCLLFVILDIVKPLFRRNLIKKVINITDLSISILFALLWLFGFCFLTHEWNMTVPYMFAFGKKEAETAIAFSFFSVLCWVILIYLEVSHFREKYLDAYTMSMMSLKRRELADRVHVEDIAEPPSLPPPTIVSSSMPSPVTDPFNE